MSTPRDMGRPVPPEEKLSYLQKPFHPHEIRQMTISLASKWRAEQRIVKLAYFDPLTGSAEPGAVAQPPRERSAIAAQAARSHTLAVLYLDLDNFKRVNDTLGHAVGDELLCMVAERMRHSLRADEGAAADAYPSPRNNHIARLGGDEFIVMLPSIRMPADAGAWSRTADRGAAAAVAPREEHAGRHAQRWHLDSTRATARTRRRCCAMRILRCISPSARRPGMHAFFDVAR